MVFPWKKKNTFFEKKNRYEHFDSTRGKEPTPEGGERELRGLEGKVCLLEKGYLQSGAGKSYYITHADNFSHRKK